MSDKSIETDQKTKNQWNFCTPVFVTTNFGPHLSGADCLGWDVKVETLLSPQKTFKLYFIFNIGFLSFFTNNTKNLKKEPVKYIF